MTFLMNNKTIMEKFCQVNYSNIVELSFKFIVSSL